MYEKIDFKNYPDTSTPLNAENLNKMDEQIAENESNIEANTKSIEDNAKSIEDLSKSVPKLDENGKITDDVIPDEFVAIDPDTGKIDKSIIPDDIVAETTWDNIEGKPDNLVFSEEVEEFIAPDFSEDISNDTVVFNSEDALNSTALIDMPLFESGKRINIAFKNLSIFVKNLRYLIKMLGTTDISTIGNGTITGAIATLYINKLTATKTVYISNIEFDRFITTVVLSGTTYSNVEITGVRITMGDRHTIIGSVLSGSQLGGTFLSYNSWQNRWVRL